MYMIYYWMQNPNQNQFLCSLNIKSHNSRQGIILLEKYYFS